MMCAMSRRKPLEGMTMEQLTQKTGVGRAAIYGWVRAGLLPHPGRHGRGARYDAAFVARVERIRELRKQNRLITAIRRGLAQEPPPPPPAAVAPVVAPVSSPVPAEKWERLTLLPGLEVSYRADGGPVLRRLAEEIWRQFAGRV